MYVTEDELSAYRVILVVAFEARRYLCITFFMCIVVRCRREVFTVSLDGILCLPLLFIHSFRCGYWVRGAAAESRLSASAGACAGGGPGSVSVRFLCRVSHQGRRPVQVLLAV